MVCLCSIITFHGGITFERSELKAETFCNLL